MKINRRKFVRQTAHGGLALGSFAALAAALGRAQDDDSSARGPLLPVVDTHQHLWDLGKLRLPWLKSAGPLNRSFVTSDYLEAIRGLNVLRAVYMEVDVAQDQQLAEAEYVLELCRRADNPTVAAVIGGRPGEENFRQYITRFKDNPYIKGVRQILHGPEPCRQKRFIRGIRLLGELGMSFDLCLPPAELTAGAELVDQCPDTRFILDHCGNADPKAVRAATTPDTGEQTEVLRRAGNQWRRDIARMARRKNVVCKISGIVARATKGSWTADDLAPTVNHCIEQFGPDRVMFGGDWPVCTRVATLGEWLTALREIVRSRDVEQQRKLLCDNAVRLYGLT